MTAETLKPFITPTSDENYVTTDSSAAVVSRHRRSCYFLAITASVIAVILTAALLGITIWNTTRISNLQTEVQSLNRVIDSLHKRLGLTYLDYLSDFEKEEENNNALIDDVLPDEDFDDDDNDIENMSGDDDDDEDEDDEEDYQELMNKFRHYQETDDDEDETDRVDSMGEDNLYDDFEKFNDSKKKHQGERKARSVAAFNDDNEKFGEKTHHERQIISRLFKDSYPKSIVANEHFERRRSPLRVLNSRRRKFPIVKHVKKTSTTSTSTTTTTNNPMETKPMDVKPIDVIPIDVKPIVRPIDVKPIEVKPTEKEVRPAAHFHITHRVPYDEHGVQINNHKGDVYIGKPSATNEDYVENYFDVEKGVITVREPGLYYVYAQICYNNDHPKNGFAIFHGNKGFLQCLQSSPPSIATLINTCHTSGLILLRQNERLHIRDFHSDRSTYLSEKSDRSYFGLIKI
ncbi:protein eiger isoform X2 [Calliphora vicina]|uniref:protein eiger isoform X2 n=1 Tax=Calliphora vicina TaxID=7373 RepID=UPI00325B7684